MFDGGVVVGWVAPGCSPRAQPGPVELTRARVSVDSPAFLLIIGNLKLVTGSVST
jgi:hypothetical protein